MSWPRRRGPNPSDYLAKRDACVGLAQMGPKARPAVPALVEALEALLARGEQACVALGKIGPTARVALPSLQKALTNSSPTCRREATLALSAWGLGVIGALVASLRDPQSANRRNAAVALGLFGDEAREAVPALAVLLKDPDVSVRQAALASLHSLAPQLAATHALPVLMAGLKDANFMNRRAACVALAQLAWPGRPRPDRRAEGPHLAGEGTGRRRAGAHGPAASRPCPTWTSPRSHNPDPDVRREAALAVRLIGYAGKGATPPGIGSYVANLKSLEWSVRRSGCVALGNLARAKAAVPDLIKRCPTPPGRCASRRRWRWARSAPTRRPPPSPCRRP